MVDLALLCNLYADGPTTLGRLRELGCESLADVERIERADLEWALQASSQNCERFRREARALRERTASSQASPQKTAPPQPTDGATRASAASKSTSDSRVVEASSGARLTSEHGSSVAANSEQLEPSTAEQSRADNELSGGAERPAPTSSILGVLLQAWRRASGRGVEGPARPRHESNERRVDAPRESFASETRSEPRLREERIGAGAAPRPAPDSAPRPATSTIPAAAAPTSVTAEFGAARTEVPTVEITPLEARPLVRGAAANAPTPTPVPAPAQAIDRRSEHGTPLERIGFQGVEADYAEQLARLGVRTVEDFLAAQPLDLAGRSSMRYTVLLRMQFLARRELERVVRG